MYMYLPLMLLDIFDSYVINIAFVFWFYLWDYKIFFLEPEKYFLPNI